MHIETPSNIHAYKLKPGILLLNIFSLIFVGIIIGISMALIISMLASSSKFEPNYRVLQYVLLGVFIPIIVLFGIVIIQQIVNTISIFSTKIKITPRGIEHRIWPYRHIRSRWSEIDRIGKFLFYDVIYLISYEVIGLSLSYTRPLKFLAFSQTSIALSSYEGWPNGQLAKDLEHYAPQLFEARVAAEEVQSSTADSNVSDISQEHRLLAALSHASVVFTGIGIFVPLLIYFAQKKRSTFLAFHALQAFFFQLIGALINFIFPFCLIGAIFIPAFSVSVAGKDAPFGAFFGAFLILTVVITMLIMFGNLACMIYGIIGAIRVYQGKDFRYVIIGKQIEKRMIPDT